MELKNGLEVPRKRLSEFVTWEGVTALATVISVGVLWIQTWELRASIQDDTYQKAQDRTYDLDRHFIDHPELRKYFYNDETLADTADEKMRAQVESTAEWISDFDDSLLSLFEDHPNLDVPSWRAFVKKSVEKSPAVRAFVSGHRDWYTDTLSKLVDQAAVAGK